MGIVRKILGEEKLTKDDLLTIKDNVEEEISGSEIVVPKPIVEKSRPTVPRSVEMFVRLDDYNTITSQIKKFGGVIEKLEELERMHTELQDIHDQFTEKLENTLTEIEEIKEELTAKLGTD